jgi:hypothetical protein
MHVEVALSLSFPPRVRQSLKGIKSVEPAFGVLVQCAPLSQRVTPKDSELEEVKGLVLYNGRLNNSIQFGPVGTIVAGMVIAQVLQIYFIQNCADCILKSRIVQPA